MNMLRPRAKLLSAIVLLSIILCACMSKHDGGNAYMVRPYIKDGFYTDGTLYYDVDKTEAFVIGTVKEESSIVIPDVVGINEVDYPLTKIQNLGVFDAYVYKSTKTPGNNKNLTSLTIGGNVKTFDEGVLFDIGYYMDTGEKYQIPRFPKLEKISVVMGNQTFDSRNNCNALILSKTNELILGCKNTVIPEGVEKISNSAFRKCEGLKTLSFPTTLEMIEPYAFSGSHLQTIDLPASVYYIGQSAFNRCDSLLTVTLRCDAVSIEPEAFVNCKSLREPNSQVSVYTTDVSILSPEAVFSQGYNKLVVPKGAASYFDSWKSCFQTIEERDK